MSDDPWAEYRVPTGSASPSPAEQFYDEIAADALTRERNARQRQAVVQAQASPDREARVRSLADRLGVSSLVVDTDLDGHQQLERMQRTAEAAKDPRLGSWLADNAGIASDDIDKLLLLRDKADTLNLTHSQFGFDAQRKMSRAEALARAQNDPDLAILARDRQVRHAQARGIIGQIAGSLRAGTALAGEGIYGTLAAGAGLLGADALERNLREGTAAIDRYAEANRGRSDSFVADSLYQGVESIPASVAAVATGSAGAGLGLFAATQGGQSYAEARAQGLSVGAATGYGASQGALEAVFEAVPMGQLLKIARGSGAKSAITRFLVSEVGGEEATTLLQNLNQWATLNPEKPFKEFLAEQPAALAQTFLGTVAAAGPQVAISHGLNLASRAQNRVDTSEAQLNALDGVMEQAAGSKARGRDPASFRALIESLGGEGKSLYVPAEVVAQYNHDFRNDEFWKDYSSEIEEGLATGGDVEVPVSDAAARLAGTPGWEAIKNDVKASPGGVSRNEIEQANAELDAIKADAGEQVDREAEHARRQAAPGEQLRESIRGRLMDAGMTPDVANTNAEIVASLFETRAKNLGIAVTGREFDPVQVQRVLPELMKSAPAETLDLVINAMRQGKDATIGEGPSLLQWIRARGGINDTGGDLKAMGVPKGIAREFDPQASLGGISGQGDYGVDSTLRAAISEGFFPELANLENEDGPSQLDTNVLFDAIRRELAGEKIYSETYQDRVRLAAEDLRAMLEHAGLSPDTMSDAEIKAAFEGEGRVFDQSFADGPHGQIQFTEAGVLIKLFETANLSTFQHEIGHFWLERLKADALASTETDGNEAARRTFADWETLKAWFKENGHPVEGDEIPVEAHELFARGWERYLMEGKAPTARLQAVFRKFAHWLRGIYRTVKALNSPITPAIREVMDRMLATQDEIAIAAAEQQTRLMFDDAVKAGMTEAEARRYAALGDEARNEAEEELYGKVMRSIRARETKQWREDEKRVRADVRANVERRPLFKALDLLRSPDGPRLDRKWLVSEYGADSLTLLPAGMPVYKDGGTNADRLAEQVGFSSGDELVRELMGLEAARKTMKEGGDKRSVKAATIDYETAQEMRERYGDPLGDGTIEREAQAAVMNERHGEKLAMELAALGRTTGRRAMPYKAAREWARDKIARGVVNETISGAAQQRYARTAAKAAKDATEAFLKGDSETAFRHKQTEMLHNALAREAAKASDKVDAALNRMGKVARATTRKSTDQDYLEQAQALLENVDLKKRSQRGIDRQGQWEAWAAAREAEGYDVVVPGSFEATLGKTNWSRLSVENLLALDEAVEQILHFGRRKQTLIDRKEARDWAAVIAEAGDGAANIKGPPPQGVEEPGFWKGLKANIFAADASLLKMETVFDWLDGGNSNGVFNRVVFRPIAEAQSRSQAMHKDYFAKLRELFNAVPPETAQRWTQRMTLPFADKFANGKPMVLTRQQIISLALNTGNEGNLQRLSDGYGINPAALERYLADTLTKEEWDFVQDVWDLLDTLWPEISALERRVNGVAPEKIEARTIETPFGKLRGGYFPAVYDSRLSYRAGEYRDASENALYEPNATRATTRSAATKERADKVNRPLYLDLGVINRHLGEVIHDITHREAVMQAWRFLNEERVMQAVDEALGPEIRQQFRPWVKFVANSWAMERAGNEGFGKWLGKLRANATAVGLGLRASTMVTQLGGYSNSIGVVGEEWIAKGIAQFSKHPVETLRFVMERSDEVRHRMDTLDRDIRTEIARISASNPLSKAKARADEAKVFMYHGIGLMDRAVSVPTWIGAYNKALSEGMSEADAAYAGDKAVRASQGAGGPKDLAAIQRGTGRWGEALKLFTMFYSYFSAQYQQQRTLARDARGLDERRDLSRPRLVANAFWLVVVPPLLTEMLKMPLGAGGPDDDEWWFQWVMRKLIANTLGPIPLARDVFEPAWNKAIKGRFTSTSLSPLQRALESIVNVSGDAGNIARGEPTKKATKHALEATGYVTGLVPGQAAAAAQFLVDVSQGDADPQTFADWLEGLSTGKIAKP